MDARNAQEERYLEELFKLTEGKIDSTISMFDIGAVQGERVAQDCARPADEVCETCSPCADQTPDNAECDQRQNRQRIAMPVQRRAVRFPVR